MGLPGPAGPVGPPGEDGDKVGTNGLPAVRGHWGGIGPSTHGHSAGTGSDVQPFVTRGCFMVLAVPWDERNWVWETMRLAASRALLSRTAS